MLDQSNLREPSTGMRLTPTTLVAAQEELGEELVAQRQHTVGSGVPKPTGPTDDLLQTEDGNRYYPIVDGIPVLMRPESLGTADTVASFDLAVPAFAEAYLEMEFYNEVADDFVSSLESSADYEILTTIASSNERFPEPFEAWIDASHDALSQLAAFEALQPFEGRTFLQTGGKGAHVLKLLLAGASAGWLLTPMVGEAVFATKLAEAFDVADRFRAVVAVAEELPFADNCFDGIYAGGCAHHFHLPAAAPELRRILSPGGAFVAIEPYEAPLYKLGTAVLGKREANAYCHPLSDASFEEFRGAFDDVTVQHHGAITRYPLLAASKAGVKLSSTKMATISRFDDKVCDRINMRRFGSSVLIRARA